MHKQNLGSYDSKWFIEYRNRCRLQNKYEKKGQKVWMKVLTSPAFVSEHFKLVGQEIHLSSTKKYMLQSPLFTRCASFPHSLSISFLSYECSNMNALWLCSAYCWSSKIFRAVPLFFKIVHCMLSCRTHKSLSLLCCDQNRPSHRFIQMILFAQISIFHSVRVIVCIGRHFSFTRSLSARSPGCPFSRPVWSGD